MSKKPTGLAAFTGKKQEAQGEDAPMPARRGRKRAQGEMVALTVRIPRADWARLHQLAVSEGVSLQTLAIEGLSKIFEAHGLSPIARDVEMS